MKLLIDSVIYSVFFVCSKIYAWNVEGIDIPEPAPTTNAIGILINHPCFFVKIDNIRRPIKVGITIASNGHRWNCPSIIYVFVIKSGSKTFLIKELCQ